VAVWQSADFEPLSVIAGLDNVTSVGEAVEQSGCHLDVAGDDDIRAPVLPALARCVYGSFNTFGESPNKFVRSAAYFTHSRFWAASLNFADACSAGVPFPRHPLW
jgi:hypothetical protein